MTVSPNQIIIIIIIIIIALDKDTSDRTAFVTREILQVQGSGLRLVKCASRVSAAD